MFDIFTAQITEMISSKSMLLLINKSTVEGVKSAVNM